MDNNSVHLIGTVKQSTEEVSGRLTFTVEVPNEKGTKMWFDCVCTNRSNAFVALEGFVNEGEPIEVIGHLVKDVRTETGKIGNSRIEVKTTSVAVYVDDVITED